MRKLFVVMVTFAMIMALSLNAHAINTVQVTLTSPAIVKTGCEQVGSVTYGFDAGSQLKVGDWWYMDLPTGTFICNPINYFIVGNGVINGAGTVTISNAAANLVTFSNIFQQIWPTIQPGARNGPLSVTSVGGNPVATIPALGSVVLRVYAQANTQRVWCYVYGASTFGTYTVGASTQFNIRILGGGQWPNAIVLDSDGDGTYGDGTVGNANADTIHGVAPHVENTLCVNAENMSGDLMFVSFDSLDDKFTFTGDAQIAHVASANPLSLVFCKGATTGDIAIGTQGSCSFDFETAAGYCPSPPASFVGNRILLQATTTFGNPGDRWSMRIFSDTPGVYFTGGATVSGFTPTATDECTGPGTAIAVAFRLYNEAGTANATAPGTSCSVGSASRVRELRTPEGAITNIETFDTMWINLPTMAYDTSIIGNGVEADVRISFRKYPCGEIFSGTHTVGTFVTTCPVGVGQTTLLFPFMPPFDGSIPGWWGGFLINNAGSIAGGVELTFCEEDGDQATLSISSIAACGMWNAGALSDLLGQVTPDPGNAGTFGDSNTHIVAVCDFNMGAGFAFTGNGDEGTGYTAYVLGAGGWQ